MTPQTCPDLAALEGLLADTRPGDRRDSLAEHLARCAMCRERLDLLARGTAPAFPLGGGGPAAGFPPSGPETDEDSVLGLLGPPGRPGAIGRLGPYDVLRVLGRGGMGVVLLADDPALRREVALKLMRPGLAARFGARERFLREARAAAAVRDDHVVAVHAVESGGAVPYLVMEYVPGRSLQDRLDAEGPLPPAEAAAMGAQVAQGLAAAHARGVVHRDVKPANILLDGRSGRARITDFGLARAADDPGLTRPGVVAGTPGYMAPEQARGRPVDHRADLYSLGAVLLAAVSGGPPSGVLPTWAAAGGTGAAGPKVARGPARGLPAGLARLIERLLDEDPGRRPASAGDVARTLRELSGQDAPWRPRRAVRAAVAAAALAGAAAGLWGVRPPGPAPASAPTAPRPEAASTAAVNPPAPGGAFAVVGGGRYDTLVAAVAAAPGGGTVEIDGDGPFPSGPVRPGAKALTIRAATGRRPVLCYDAEDQSAPSPWLETDGSLALEGLDVRAADRRRPGPVFEIERLAAVAVRGGPFRAAGCRFVVAPQHGCVALRGAPAEVLACRFEAADAGGLYWAPAPGQTLELRQSLVLARRAVIVDVDRPGAGPERAALRVVGSTVRADTAFHVLGTIGQRPRNFTDPSRLDIVVEADGCTFDVAQLLALLDAVPARRPASPPTAEAVVRLLKARFEWRGRANRYPAAPGWLAFGTRGHKILPLEDGPADLGAWGRLWGGTDADSVAAELSPRDQGRGQAPEPSSGDDRTAAR